MGHSAAIWDYRAAIEITKDWNGIDQVVLRNPQGATAKVEFFLFLSWFYSSNDFDFPYIYTNWYAMV